MVNKFILTFSFAGLLFAGYLSFYKFFTKTCALNEACPTFLGQPACYFGLVMYLTLFLLSIGLVSKKLRQKTALLGIIFVSFLGILFAGNFTIEELPVLFESGLGAYALVLPTCALGLIFYILIFALSLFAKIKKPQTS